MLYILDDLLINYDFNEGEDSSYSLFIILACELLYITGINFEKMKFLKMMILIYASIL